MIIFPKSNISADYAKDLLWGNKPLLDVYVGGALNIETCEAWNKDVTLYNCILENLSAINIQFTKPVKLVNCHLKNCQFHFSHFLAGLTIDNCTFESHLDFQAGGHNKDAHAFTIINSDFKGFVNFFDCWFESDVFIYSNNFRAGTNIYGSPNGIPVTFDGETIINNNIGQLGLNQVR